jgi:hypothetical protein
MAHEARQAAPVLSKVSESFGSSISDAAEDADEKRARDERRQAWSDAHKRALAAALEFQESEQMLPSSPHQHRVQTQLGAPIAAGAAQASSMSWDGDDCAGCCCCCCGGGNEVVGEAGDERRQDGSAAWQPHAGLFDDLTADEPCLPRVAPSPGLDEAKGCCSGRSELKGAGILSDVSVQQPTPSKCVSEANGVTDRASLFEVSSSSGGSEAKFVASSAPPAEAGDDDPLPVFASRRGILSKAKGKRLDSFVHESDYGRGRTSSFPSMKAFLAGTRDAGSAAPIARILASAEQTSQSPPARYRKIGEHTAQEGTDDRDRTVTAPRDAICLHSRGNSFGSIGAALGPLELAEAAAGRPPVVCAPAQNMPPGVTHEPSSP